MNQTRLFSNSTLFSFMLIVGALVYYSVPSDFELGLFKAASYQEEEAALLLADIATNRFHKATALRNFAEVMEKLGKPNEAMLTYQRLVEMKPRNKVYWQNLIRLQTWTGLNSEAVQSLEKSQRSFGELNISQYRKLIQSYEWLHQREPVSRIYKEIFLKRLATSIDYQNAIRFFYHEGDQGYIDRQILSRISKKELSTKFFFHLMLASLDSGRDKQAIIFAALYLGATKEEGSGAFSDSSYLNRLAKEKPAVIIRELEILDRLNWTFARLKKPNLRIPVYRARFVVEKLDLSEHFDLLDIVSEGEGKQAALEELKVLSKRKDLSKNDWKKVSRHFLWLGQPKMASKILEILLDNRLPKWRGNDLTWIFQPSVWLANADSQQFTDAIVSMFSAPKTNERLKTYLELLNAYDAQSAHQKSILLIKKMFREDKLGQIFLTKKMKITLKERAAFRYAWTKKTKSSFQILKSLKEADLSPNAHALKVLSASYLGKTSEAFSLLERFPMAKRRSLKADLSKGIEDLEKQWSMEKRLKEIDQKIERPVPTEKAFSPFDQFFLSAKLIGVSQEIFHIAGTSILKSELHGRFRLDSQGESFLTTSNAFVPSVVFHGLGRVGYLKRWKNLEGEIQLGVHLTGELIRPQSRLRLSGAILGADFASVDVDFDEANWYGTDAVSQVISENSASVYFEKTLSDFWNSIWEGKYRSTNRALKWNAAQGPYFYHASEFRPFHSFWAIGPWFQYFSWNTNDRFLSAYLPAESLLLGAMAKIQVWNYKKTGWKFSFSPAYGLELNQEIAEDQAGRIESSLEKVFFSRLGLQVVYNYYTSALAFGAGSGTHHVKVFLNYELN